MIAISCFATYRSYPGADRSTGQWLEVRISDQSGASDYDNITDGGYFDACALIAECAESPNARHPAAWTNQRDRAAIICPTLAVDAIVSGIGL